MPTDSGVYLLHSVQPDHAVLLLHGMTGTPTELIHLARRLHQDGYDVHCPVLPGHLQGREEVMTPTWQDWLKFSLGRFDELAAKYSHLVVGGVCLGAVLAAGIGAERKPKAVISLAPILKLNGWSIPWYNWFTWFALTTPLKYFFVFPEGDTLGIRDSEVRATVGAKMAQKGNAIDCFPLICVKEMLGLGRYVCRNLNKVQAPFLAIHSIRDDLADISASKILFTGVSSMRKEFLQVENSYHLITLDKDRDLVAQKVTDFLKSESSI